MKYNLSEFNHRRNLSILAIGDIDELIAESQDTFIPSAKHPVDTSASLLARLQSDAAFAMYGFMIGGQPASYIVALGGRYDQEIAIGPMYVGKVFRGQGLGAEQIDDFIHTYKHQGYTSVFTKTWASNMASRRIFDERGFAVIGHKPRDRANGDDTIVYQLDI